jgi:hypothetical protein
MHDWLRKMRELRLMRNLLIELIQEKFGLDLYTLRSKFYLSE